MGKIVGAQGIRGHIKVYSYTRPVTQLLQYKKWHLAKNEAQWINHEEVKSHTFTTLDIAKGSEKGNGTLMVNCGIDNRNDAELLTNNFIFINGEQLPVLPENEYYWFQLVGLKVQNLEGHYFGEVQELFDNGANDIMIVNKDVEVQVEEKNKDKEKVMVNKIVKEEAYLPYDWQFIKSIDADTNTITIDWPAEL